MGEPAGAAAAGQGAHPLRHLAGGTPRPLRCAAVGLHLDPDRATSAVALVSSIAELLARELPADPGVDTLVTLPEHTGLLAMLVGERGAAARERWRAGGSTLEILFALAGGYGEVLGELAPRYPEVHSAGQLLHLACTDTVVATLVEGLGGLAAQRGVWLSVGAALPHWELVPREDAEVDGEGAGRTHVAVPTGPGVRNRQLLLAPTGELAAIHDKVALVPLEADGEAGLGLEAASLAEVAVADLPIGRVGTVISKDAWMPDVNERLDQLGAEILLQPEAFDRWGEPDRDPATGHVDLWPPDKFQRGGWWMVQRHPSFRVNLAPMLLGTLGELSFDGQPLIAVPSPGGQPGLGLLGQPPDTGWAAVGRWWREAGGEGSRGVALPAARAAAGRIAEALPSSGPRDGVAVARVVLPARRAGAEGAGGLPHHPAVSDSFEVAYEPGEVQLVPDLVADPLPSGSPDPLPGRSPGRSPGPRRAWLAWVACDVTGRQQLRLAAGDGRSWQAPEALSPAPEAGVDPVVARRWRPRLAVDDHGPVCAHLAFPAGNWDLFAVRPAADTSTPVRLDDAEADHGVLRERLHDAPAIAADGAGLVVVWSDLRWPWVFPQVRLSRSADGGATWSPSVRVDAGSLMGEADPLAGRSADETRGQTTPSAAVWDGQLVVAWQERDAAGVPSIALGWPDDPAGPAVRTLVRVSPGGAAAGPGGAPEGSDGASAASDPVPGPVLEIGGDRVARPVLAVAGTTLWAVWEVWDAGGGAALWTAMSPDGGRRWSSARPVDPGCPAAVQQQRACLVPVGQRTATVVFGDDRTGTSQILAVDLQHEGGEVVAAAPVRIDDAPPGAHARAPSAAWLGTGLVVVWQDTRTGTEQLRTAHLGLKG